MRNLFVVWSIIRSVRRDKDVSKNLKYLVGFRLYYWFFD